MYIYLEINGNKSKQMKYSNLQIDPQIHHKVKIHCVVNKIPMKDLIEKLINDYLNDNE